MSALGFYGWGDFALAAVTGFLLLAQLMLFTLVALLVVLPLWLISFAHIPHQLHHKNISS